MPIPQSALLCAFRDVHLQMSERGLSSPSFAGKEPTTFSLEAWHDSDRAKMIELPLRSQIIWEFKRGWKVRRRRNHSNFKNLVQDWRATPDDDEHYTYAVALR